MSYLGLGSNLGDRFENLRDAVKRLDGVSGITVTKASYVYETDPVGGVAQPDYYNAALKIKTSFKPGELLKVCLDTEHEMGRVRSEKWGPRVIDIDILLYGDSIIDTHDLKVPHPLMAERAFVLYPLADIAPDTVHPDNGKTVNELRDILVGSGVRKISDLKLL
ncbi:2-amino-4-hydroxy-6-hydroxymethyldihydropteridine diphosphokinase [Candidatus Latescibacterota bacterium]